MPHPVWVNLNSGQHKIILHLTVQGTFRDDTESFLTLFFLFPYTTQHGISVTFPKVSSQARGGWGILGPSVGKYP